MDNKTAHTLVKLNTAFYQTVCDSFSNTRQAPWKGWNCINKHIPSSFWERSPLRVLDLACGNGRFEQFLASSHPDTAIQATCIDSCDELFTLEATSRHAHISTTFHHWDILNEQDGAPSNLPVADLSVCFGFFHHIPRKDWREHVLDYLLSQTRPEAYCALSFWSFMNDSAFAQKALRTHEEALQWFATSTSHDIDFNQLDAQDYFLGWQQTKGVYRYCHSYTSAEIDELLASISHAQNVTVVERFYADGKNNNLNEYILLQRK